MTDNRPPEMDITGVIGPWDAQGTSPLIQSEVPDRWGVPPAPDTSTLPTTPTDALRADLALEPSPVPASSEAPWYLRHDRKVLAGTAVVAVALIGGAWRYNRSASDSIVEPDKTEQPGSPVPHRPGIGSSSTRTVVTSSSAPARVESSTSSTSGRDRVTTTQGALSNGVNNTRTTSAPTSSAAPLPPAAPQPETPAPTHTSPETQPPTTQEEEPVITAPRPPEP